MELDELKKTWNHLDKQLDKQPLTDEAELAKLMEQCRKNTGNHLKRILRVQRISLLVGCVALCMLLVWGVWTIPSVAPERLAKHYGLISFLAVSLVAAITWDTLTYRKVSSIRVDVMPVAEVAQRMGRFRRRIRLELWVVSLWLLLFYGFNYWYNSIYLLELKSQLLHAAVVLLFDVCVVYFLYKYAIYRPLQRAEKSLKEGSAD